MGIVLKPRDESSSSRKGKGKAAPSGHVIFVDGREECESPTLRGRSITNLQSSNGKM
jgi:predicted RNA-binding protein with TRAM domain